jgi:integrase
MMTFAQALAHWIEARCLSVRPRTQELYRDVQRLLLRAWPCPDQPLDQITPDNVLVCARAFRSQCATRWNLAVSALRALTPHAAMLRRRPVQLRMFRPPPPDQFLRFLAALDRCRKSHVGLVVRFLCFTGLRMGEAWSLRWSEVDGDGLWVRPEHAKNGRGRWVPILPDLPPVLERLGALEKERCDGRVLPPGDVRKVLRQVSRQVLGEAWSYHSCRHWFATWCIQCGVDLPTVARWLGHVDGGALLARVYYHLADHHSRRMAACVRLIPPQAEITLARGRPLPHDLIVGCVGENAHRPIDDPMMDPDRTFVITR